MKPGIRLHGFAIVDDIWKTCCALHNVILEDGGLDPDWNEGTQGDWETEWGLHDRHDWMTARKPH